MINRKHVAIKLGYVEQILPKEEIFIPTYLQHLFRPERLIFHSSYYTDNFDDLLVNVMTGNLTKFHEYQKLSSLFEKDTKGEKPSFYDVVMIGNLLTLKILNNSNIHTFKDIFFVFEGTIAL